MMDALKTDKILLTYPNAWNKRIDALKTTYGMASRQQVLRYILAGFLEEKKP